MVTIASFCQGVLQSSVLRWKKMEIRNIVIHANQGLQILYDYPVFACSLETNPHTPVQVSVSGMIKTDDLSHALFLTTSYEDALNWETAALKICLILRME